jgi:hypothetical protein
VQADWQAKRIKRWDIKASDLAMAARAYLASHPELLEQARAFCAEFNTNAQRHKR